MKRRRLRTCPICAGRRWTWRALFRRCSVSIRQAGRIPESTTRGAACRCSYAMPACASPSPRWTACSTPRPRPRRGKRLWMRLDGIARPCGFTATCSPATCWREMAAYAPSSISAVWAWLILPVTCVPAWNFLDAEARQALRSTLAVDDATWAACGWALSVALIALPYYLHTNPPSSPRPGACSTRCWRTATATHDTASTAHRREECRRYHASSMCAHPRCKRVADHTAAGLAAATMYRKRTFQAASTA